MIRSRSFALDFVRGLAALAVLLTHLRLFVFQDLDRLVAPGFLMRSFYHLTGLGHQAVMIFFVMSGYLVGGSIMKANREGFWLNYAVQRLTRLWIVLLPCLLATLALNWLGHHTGGAAYLGGDLNPPVGFAPLDAVRTDWRVFLGNGLFLQTITVPVFGDNGPLWSLANEFWYYVVFPFLFFGLAWTVRTPAVVRCAYLAIAGTVLYLLPAAIVQGFAIWLLGAAASAIPARGRLQFFSRWWFGAIALVVFLVVLHLSRLGKASDLSLGAAFALTLPILVRVPPREGWLGSVAAWSADFSFTLYLAHSSLIGFVWYTYFNCERLAPSLGSMGRFAGLALVVIGYSFVLSCAFERNTDRLRRKVMTLVKRPFPKSPTG